MKSLFLATLAAGALVVGAANAQGLVGGAADGAAAGGAAAGPVGAIVGGAVGAATGTVGGILGVDQRPRFRRYVTGEHVRSYAYSGPVRAGVVLPETGVTYYDAPADYGLRSYRYTVVNDTPVIVEPGTRRIVEVVE
jgi:hypothetical protein